MQLSANVVALTSDNIRNLGGRIEAGRDLTVGTVTETNRQAIAWD